MKFGFKFSNLCGSVYRKGNLVFTPDGNCVLSPVGNRVTVFDLVNHKSFTLPFENLKNIARLALSPNGVLLLSVDEDGRALLANLPKRAVLCAHHFQKPVKDVKFSPDGRFIAVTHGTQTQLWRSPGPVTQFRPFALHRTLTGHYQEVLSIEWSNDSRFLLTTSRDCTCRLYSVDPHPNFVPMTLSGHRSPVLAAFFCRDRESDIANLREQPSPFGAVLYTVSRDGSLFTWRFERVEANGPRLGSRDQHKRKRPRAQVTVGGAGDSKKVRLPASSPSNAEDGPEEEDSERVESKEDEPSATALVLADGAEEEEKGSVPIHRGKYVLASKFFFKQNAKATSAALHYGQGAELLVVGFQTGTFGLYELPDCNLVHTLSIGSARISTVAVSPSGEWLAFGSAKLGQLLVWEWQSESYVLKQQGHASELRCLAYSPDGQIIATGGEDGSLKLWNTSSGFCFVTFREHSAPITALTFTASGTVVLSASADGTVRAYDLVRYRAFRTLTSPEPAQFMSLAVDPAGELVCAGAMDPFEIYVWSLQTGKLLDVLAGHEGPVSGLAFTPAGATVQLLASCSWDRSVRLWDLYNKNTAVEALNHNSDVLAVAFRPDGRELCSASLDGQLYLWDATEGTLKQNIDAKRDVKGGRLENDAQSAEKSTHSLAFTSLCYSADGTCVLAGGNSKYVCIYELSQKILLKKFQISHNRSLDGMTEMLNSKYMTEAGPLSAVDADLSGSEDERVDRSLPGAKTSDFSSRKAKPIARTKCVRFSPTGRQWAAATTEGLLLYSLDDASTFDPSELDMELTPAAVLRALEEGAHAKALVMALRLNEKPLLQQVLLATPAADTQLVARSVPTALLPRLLAELSKLLTDSPHLEFLLLWTQQLLTVHGAYLRNNANTVMTTLRSVQKSLSQQHKDLARLCGENQYRLDYLAAAPPSGTLEVALSTAPSFSIPAPSREDEDEKVPSHSDSDGESESTPAAAAKATGPAKPKPAKAPKVKAESVPAVGSKGSGKKKT